MNDRGLYQSVLIEFRDTYGNVADRLQALIAAAKWREAEVLAHTLKGTSGMLSADALYSATTALDNSLKVARDGSDPPATMGAELVRLRQELVRLLVGINRLAEN